MPFASILSVGVTPTPNVTIEVIFHWDEPHPGAKTKALWTHNNLVQRQHIDGNGAFLQGEKQAALDTELRRFRTYALADKPDFVEVLGEAPLGEVWYTGILGGVPLAQ